jgi:hypothetical protein
MNQITAVPCALKNLLYVQEKVEFYAVNQLGEATERVQTGSGLWCYRCRGCTAKFDNRQAALSHIQASGSNEEAAR